MGNPELPAYGAMKRAVNSLPESAAVTCITVSGLASPRSVGEDSEVCHSFATCPWAVSSLRTSTTEPVVIRGGWPVREKPFMRKNPLLPLALACAALVLGAGPALAASSTPTPQPTKASPSTAQATAAPSAAQSTKPTGEATAPPSAAPATTSPGQVESVPQGAPDTGVPHTASGNSDTVVTSSLAAGAVLLGGVGVVVMRRRSKVRG